MTPKNIYKSYNAGKTIEELQYNMLQYRTRLKDLETEFQFFEFLLNAPIYHSTTINLFENLQQFKTTIRSCKKQSQKLVMGLSTHTNQIAQKIECEDLICDHFFIQNHDTLELEIDTFFDTLSGFKIRMFQYLESVIKA